MSDHRMRHPVWSPMMLLVLVLMAVFALFYFNLATAVFQRLGLSASAALLVLGTSLVGSVVNIPLTRRRVVLADPRVESLPPVLQSVLPVLHFYPPVVAKQVLALNVGGAVVPIVFSAYLITMPTTSVAAAIGTMAIVAAVAKVLAHPEPSVGITLPGFIPPLVAAIAAHWLAGMAGANAAPVAYIGGTLGTLIGADLLNLPAIMRGSLASPAAAPVMLDPATGQPVPRTVIASIGGAGVFDGIFLTGIVAPLLA